MCPIAAWSLLAQDGADRWLGPTAGFSEAAARRWPLLAAMGALLVALLAFRLAQRCRRRAPSCPVCSALAGLAALPSRLLSALHTGDVRMHVAWMAVGAIVLLAMALSAALPAPSRTAGAIPAWTDFVASVSSKGEHHPDLSAAWPQLALVAAAVGGLLAKIAFRRRAFVPAIVLAVVGILAAGAVVLHAYTPLRYHWRNLMGLVVLDPYAVFAELVVLGTGLAALLAGVPMLGRMGPRRADFVATAVLSLTGMTLAVASTDFLTLYTSLALMLLCNYILLGMQTRDAPGTEATLKYFVTSLAASGLLLFGVALLYGASGDTQFTGVREGLAAALAGDRQAVALVRIGLALVLAGTAYLVGAAPFHMQTSDLAAGAPPASAAFVLATPLVTGVLVAFRLMASPLAPVAEALRDPLLLLGTTSAVVGALVGWVQESPRRAAGYLMVSLIGALVVGLAEKAVAGDASTWPALVLAATPVAILAAGFLVALFSGMSMSGWDATAGASPIRRGAASGIALVLGLLLLYASVLTAAHTAAEGLTAVRRTLLTVAALGLVAAGARWLDAAWSLALRRSDRASDRVRFAAAGLFVVLVGVALAPLAFVEQIARAVELTWFR